MHSCLDPLGEDRGALDTLLPALAGYAVLAVLVAPLVHADLFWDDLAYLQLGRHWAAGRVDLAIDGCWSPLLSWLMVPFVWVGTDPFTVVHGVALALGGLQVVGAWMLGRRLGLRGTWLGLATGVVAVMTLTDSARLGTPDVLVSGLLLVLLSWITAPDLLERPGLQLACGVLGALAYLAKAYALPFLLLHVPLTLWLRRRDLEEGEALPALAPSMRRILGVMLALSLPWIVALSLHHGWFTISTAGGINHAILNPDWPYANHPTDLGLWPVPAGRLQAWEAPTELPYPSWSPFWSRRHMETQARIVLFGAVGFLINQDQRDALHLRLAGFLVLLALPLLARRRGRRSSLELWILATLVLFHGGYLPLLNLPTRYYHLTRVLLALWAIRLLAAGEQSFGPRHPAARLALRAALATLVLISIPLQELVFLRTHLRQVERPAALLELAPGLRQAGVSGSFASTALEDYPLALHLGMPFLGVPTARSAAGLARELEAAGAGFLLDWEERPEVLELARGGGIELLLRRRIRVAPDREASLSVYRVAGASR